jgi:protein phosphatase 2C family protein 2/3
METHDKRSHSIFPNSTRGLKKANNYHKEFQPLSTNQKKQSNEKFLYGTNYSKLTELLEIKNPNKTKNFPGISTSNPKSLLMNHKVLFSPFRYYEEAKFSTKSYGSIVSYGVNTNQGQVRNYNEDRVSIILNVIKPPSRKNEEWPKVSFFGIFDGHGGKTCSDFLKENLHHYV